MAAKVALTAEEFRENSQRSIALFNTEKLSTDSTHVLKSAYCNSVHFCRCNLHGACGGKDVHERAAAAGGVLQSARGVWRQSESPLRVWAEALVAICTGRVEAKFRRAFCRAARLRVAICTGRVEAKFATIPSPNAARKLQSARGVWRQRSPSRREASRHYCCNLHGACGGKGLVLRILIAFFGCNLHGACGGKVVLLGAYNTFYTLQSARGVWKTLHHPPEKNPRKFMQTYCIFIHFGV